MKTKDFPHATEAILNHFVRVCLDSPANTFDIAEFKADVLFFLVRLI